MRDSRLTNVGANNPVDFLPGPSFAAAVVVDIPWQCLTDHVQTMKLSTQNGISHMILHSSDMPAIFSTYLMDHPWARDIPTAQRGIDFDGRRIESSLSSTLFGNDVGILVYAAVSILDSRESTSLNVPTAYSQLFPGLIYFGSGISHVWRLDEGITFEARGSIGEPDIIHDG